jgi:formylglycine-generating enzyme required for sulfatase activity
MSHIIAERRLKQFHQKFGESMVEFATHAALPVVLNSELVHLLRLNFFYSSSSISYLTEVEFLLSSFCREIGEDLYEIEPAMRTVLLQKLYQQYPEHIKEIAALLWQYTTRYTPWRTREGLQQAQLLTALNFIDTQKATEWLLNVEANHFVSSEKREWFVAIQKRIKQEQKLQGIAIFEFETVTVNRRGEMIERVACQAQYVTEELGDEVVLEMVAIPGGTFLMGSSENEKRHQDDESPQHEVTVSPFFMSKYPVTQTQWEAVMGNNPSYVKGKNRPVEKVSWDDAVEFCEKLSKTTGNDCRLPSEAEWEYACRAGTTTPFYFGETITTDLANYEGNYTYADEPKGIYRKGTIEVGQFPPNAFGLYDMHGNVWEWVADNWHSDYTNAPNDGKIWAEGADKNDRVLRGGSWEDVSINTRAAVRSRFNPDVRYYGIGFRVVRRVVARI